MDIKEIINQRVDKLNKLKEKGLSPYRANFKKTDSIAKIRSSFKEGQKIVVSVAARLVSKRLHGKAGFSNLQDSTGRLQIYLKQDLIGKERFKDFSELDIGDIIGVKGELFVTRTGELTIQVAEFLLLSKALRPLPEKWHGLKDVEARYRQRYLDIISNEKVKDIFINRTKAVSLMRKFLDDLGYLEVETPMMHLIPGGAAGRHFKTHHNEYDMDLFLRIAPELHLKRLLVAGYEKVYEVNRNFRNEGISTRHNPEFTMLEVYSAYSDYEDMMRLTEDIVRFLARTLLGTETIEYQGKKIDLTKWERISFCEEMKKNFDINPQDSLDEWIEKLSCKNIKLEHKNISRSFVANLIADLLQPKGDHPVFVTDLFTELCPLAKTKKDNPYISERFELFIAGMELANAYSELNDPIEQRSRIEEGLEAGQNIDEDFITALEYGMPPAGGLGIGIDRLVMLLTNQASIREVILFPLLKPVNRENLDQ